MSKKKDSQRVLPVALVLAIAGVAFLGGRISVKLLGDQSGKELAKGKVVTFTPAKEAVPIIKFFVMSFCPFGNQAEAMLRPVAELLGDKVNWQPVYIVSDAKKSCELGCGQQVYDETNCQNLVKAGRIPDMETCRKYFPYNSKEICLQKECAAFKEGEYASLHGQQELNQNVRELCVWNQGDQGKWWDFVERVNEGCTYENADSCWEEQAVASGLDAAKIKECEAEQASELLAKELVITSEYGVGSSPTFIFNGKRFPPEGAYPKKEGEIVNLKIGKEIFTPDQYRSPEVLKDAICAGFEKPPKECKEKLEDINTGSAGGC